MFRRFVLLMMFLMPLAGYAGVNPKNGNYYVSYTDVSMQAKSHKLALVRTYNSKSPYVGWFGQGWGTSFEMQLTILPDDTAVITENGGGADSFFHDEGKPRDRQKVEQGIARIVQAARERDGLTDSAAADFAKKLLGDEEARMTAVRKYAVQSELPEGLELRAVDRGYCAGTLKRTATGYRRDNGCGELNDFDSQLRLVRITAKDGYQIDLRYEQTLVELSDSDGQRLRFFWSQKGQLVRLESSQECGAGKVCSAKYHYDDSRNLIESFDVEGNHYRYFYDRNGNMTRIAYVDGSNMFLSYDRLSAVTSLTERNGSRQLFEYREDQNDPNHYFTRIHRIGSDGNRTQEDLEFAQSYTPTGERGALLYSSGSDHNKVTTQLDDKARVIRKQFGEQGFIAYTYDPQNGKIASVNVNDEIGARYRYNKAGYVVHAENTQGQVVDFGYDRQNRIVEMRTREGRGKRHVIRIQYNETGKPMILRQDKFAPVVIQYDDEGEIRSVDSPDGIATALSVTSTFQTMLSIIKLAELAN